MIVFASYSPHRNPPAVPAAIGGQTSRTAPNGAGNRAAPVANLPGCRRPSHPERRCKRQESKILMADRAVGGRRFRRARHDRRPAHHVDGHMVCDDHEIHRANPAPARQAKAANR